MRRRRLIGVYRGLLMSIWMPWLRFEVMSAAAARGGSTRREQATRPHRQTSRSGCAAQSRRMVLLRAPPRVRITSPSVALTIASRYARPRVVPTLDVENRSRLTRHAPGERLGTDARAAGRSQNSEAGMTTFDKREEGFEKKFAIDEELRFKATARRNKLLGLWAAQKLGLSGVEADKYAKAIVLADFEEPGEHDVFRKIRKDFDAKGVTDSDHQIRRTMTEFMARAVLEVKAGR